jgi:hypothetical protein
MSARTMPHWAGLREYRRNRRTGAMVGVYDGEAAGLDTDGGRWSTVCEDHSTIIAFHTLAAARDHAAVPDSWCEPCYEATR